MQSEYETCLFSLENRMSHFSSVSHLFSSSLLLVKIEPDISWKEANTHIYLNQSTHNSTVAGWWLCAEEAGLTHMSQSAIYQPIALTDGPHATANSKPLVSHTSTQADVLIWHRALFYLRSIVTSNLASEQHFILWAAIWTIISYYEKYQPELSSRFAYWLFMYCKASCEFLNSRERSDVNYFI